MCINYVRTPNPLSLLVVTSYFASLHVLCLLVIDHCRKEFKKEDRHLAYNMW
jgi:hypothetical protein